MNVYFLEAVGCKPAVVKIGISSDIASRTACLQTAMPFKLELLGWVAYASATAARAAERKLHKKLKLKRMEGEWFRLTPKTRDFIAILACGSASVPPPVAVKPRFEKGSNEPNYEIPPATRSKNGRFQSGILRASP